MSPEEKRSLIQAVGKFVCEEVERGRKPLLERIEEQERRIRELEQPRFKGVYQRCNHYQTGSEVTHCGSLWVAIAPISVNEAPGKSVGWQLCVKSGSPHERAFTRPTTVDA